MEKQTGKRYLWLLLLIPGVIVPWIVLKREAGPAENNGSTEYMEEPAGMDPEAESGNGHEGTLCFDFGDNQAREGCRRVGPEQSYSEDASCGFVAGFTLESFEMPEKEDGETEAGGTDFILGREPFLFLADVPEGNYDVKITAVGTGQGSRLTLKAESRRLMIRDAWIPAGEVRELVFTTNVRYPETRSGNRVRLKPREIGHLNWDRQLSVEFGGLNPAVAELEISPNEGAMTVFLAGNSTVTDQRCEPYSAWGQMLPVFFKPRLVAVANHAESGEALKSFVAENRLEKMLDQVRPGDCVLIQFGHNDQKPQSTAYSAPFTDYQYYLRQYIMEVRNLGATPVLVTPMLRRNFNEEGIVINTHGDYPEAMRQVAETEGVVLIDLFAMSKTLYEALGPEGSKKLFVHYPAGSFPGQEEELKDDSHHSTYGAYELARCVVEGIRGSGLELAGYLRDEIPPFDPARPDPFDQWQLPLSPYLETTGPEGK